MAVLAPMPSASVRIATAAKPGLRTEQTKAERRVLPQLRGELADATTALHRVPQLRQRLGARLDLAELLQRLRARVRRRHALADELVGAHVEVKGELVADVAADLVAGAVGKAEEAFDVPGTHIHFRSATSVSSYECIEKFAAGGLPPDSPNLVLAELRL